MGSLDRIWLGLAAIGGLLAVAMGAFGAHGMEDPQARQWLATGANYLMTHSLAVFAAAFVAAGGSVSKPAASPVPAAAAAATGNAAAAAVAAEAAAAGGGSGIADANRPNAAGAAAPACRCRGLRSAAGGASASGCCDSGLLSAAPSWASCASLSASAAKRSASRSSGDLHLRSLETKMVSRQ